MNKQRHQRFGEQEGGSIKEIFSSRQEGRRAKRKAGAEEKDRKKKQQLHKFPKEERPETNIEKGNRQGQKKYHERKRKGKMEMRQEASEKREKKERTWQEGVNGAEE